ncbi:MAG: hypothetical protein IT424_05855 [Pirellulales bacterium]|nr:hypothetical protein [Pirellulales bacterium]
MAAALAPLWALTAGCGDGGPELIAVTGVVTIDGAPAKEGGVTFHSVGNPNVQLAASIGPDGKYSIIYHRELGAPAGKYAVAVLVTETKQLPDGSYTGLPKTISNPKFLDPATSSLKVEVRKDAPPDAYNLAVTR